MKLCWIVVLVGISIILVFLYSLVAMSSRSERFIEQLIEYGWDVAVYSSIEHIYGYDYVTSCYKDNPQDSWKQLVDYMHEMFPDATDKQIRKVLK